MGSSKVHIGTIICSLLFSAGEKPDDLNLPQDPYDVLRFPYSDYSAIPYQWINHHTIRVIVERKTLPIEKPPFFCALIEPKERDKCKEFRKALDEQETRIRKAGLLDINGGENVKDFKDLKTRIKAFEEDVENRVEYPGKWLNARSCEPHGWVLKLQMNERLEVAVDDRKWTSANDHFGLAEDVAIYELPSVKERIKELRAINALSDVL